MRNRRDVLKATLGLPALAGGLALGSGGPRA